MRRIKLILNCLNIPHAASSRCGCHSHNVLLTHRSPLLPFRVESIKHYSFKKFIPQSSYRFTDVNQVFSKSHLQDFVDATGNIKWFSQNSDNFYDDKGHKKVESINVQKQNIYTVPNFLSCFRIGITPYIGYLIVNSDYTTALALFILASFTDWLDGAIARKWPSQQSAIGTALDPLGDKILVAVVCTALTIAHIMPWPLTLLFISRDFLLIVGVFHLRYRTCPRPVTLKRYFDPSLVNVKLAPTTISKMNTALQMLLIWMSAAAPVFEYVDHVALQCMWGLTATTTVLSAFSYAKRKDTVQIVDDKSRKEKSV